MSTAVISREQYEKYEAPSVRAARVSLRWGFLEFFVISQTALPALLYLPGSQPLRLAIRIASYAISLGALIWWVDKKRLRKLPPHPAQSWLILAFLLLLLMILHPTTNTVLAGVAQTLLYVSVFAPVFWVPSMVQGPKHLTRLLVILLACNSINAFVGLMQVYDPARWLPQEFSTIVSHSMYGVGYLTYIGPNGQRIVRPPGLFDYPGAVCAPAMFSAVFGLIFVIGERASLYKRLGALGGAFVSVAVIYLTEVRTSFLIMLGMLAVYVGVTLMLGQRAKAFKFLGLAALLVVIGFFYATVLGGESIKTRFFTLIEGDPMTVYYNAGRGAQMEEGLTSSLIDYPLGAGLGRWGMMRVYFGDPSNPDSPPLWAELQIPAWILDGGLMLALFYSLALSSVLVEEFQIVKSSKGSILTQWAPAVFAVNVGTLALVFGSVLFLTNIGLQYWFLVGALYGAYKREVLLASK